MNRDSARLETTVPRPWLDRLQALARDRGKSLEEVTREAIAAYLGISPIEVEIATLRQEIGELSRLTAQISALNLRVSRLEGRISPQTAPDPLENETENDYEDEPDEILNDFLPN